MSQSHVQTDRPVSIFSTSPHCDCRSACSMSQVRATRARPWPCMAASSAREGHDRCERETASESERRCGRQGTAHAALARFLCTRPRGSCPWHATRLRNPSHTGIRHLQVSTREHLKGRGATLSEYSLGNELSFSVSFQVSFLVVV